MTHENDLPIVQPLCPTADAEQVFLRLRHRPHCLFLDSALGDPQLGRYSFVTADPFGYLEVPADGSDALSQLAQRLAKWSATTVPGLPPFQGGAAGLFSYDLSRSLERVPAAEFDEFQVPALAIGFYDVVVAFDHVQRCAWIVSQGLPDVEPGQRRQRAQERLAEFQGWISDSVRPSARGVQHSGTGRTILPADLAPQHPIDEMDRLTSDFSAAAYRRTVQRAIDYIYEGDVFQVNLSQRLLYPALDDTAQLYLRLRRRNPATFAAYFDLGEFQIASASPERLISVRGGQVEARPIKGTRQRTRHPEADLFAGDDLLQSEKDRAENVMIVDLLRNDLSKICQPKSVHVTDLCRLEVYQYVQHLVSVVCGRLVEACGPVDVVRATFPGGSITGAPKVRAMEIVSQLEPTARGPYCGSLGYLGFDGTLDLSILIRTITAGRGWWQLPVGGGIVAQSVPAAEYDETWHKAKGLIKALK